MDATWLKMSIPDRMVYAVERVRERMQRATSALEAAGVPYAVAGGNAVAVWVATIDEAAVRNTQDVDILLRREDLDAVEQALKPHGFIRRKVAGIEMFLDGAEAKPRDAVRIFLSGEPIHAAGNIPDVSESVMLQEKRILKLDSIVQMALMTYKLDDQVDLRDMLDVGLIDQSWTSRLPEELAAKLQLLIDTPDG